MCAAQGLRSGWYVARLPVSAALRRCVDELGRSPSYVAVSVERPGGQGPVSSPTKERQLNRTPCVFVNERIKPVSTVPPNLLSEETLSLTEDYAQC